MVFYLAYVPSGNIRNFNKVGDYSYGIYIYAFPVQQSIAALVANVTVATMVILSFVVTLFLSILSWQLVEKKFLKMKDIYVFFEQFLKNRRLKLLLSGKNNENIFLLMSATTCSVVLMNV